MSFIYDGQSEPVQVASQAALTTVLAAIARLLNAPGAAALAKAQDLAVMAGTAPDSQASYAAAVAALFADYVAAVVANAQSAPTPAPAVGFAYASRLPPTPPDPSFGLAGVAALSGAIMPLGMSGQIMANWLALMQLVEGDATAATATLYAQTTFVAAADAEAARSQIAELIIAQIEAASGNDPLIMAWRGLFTAAVTDLTMRASGLPNVATVTLAAPLPSAYIAQLLYQDGTQSAPLVRRNAAPHPLFMPLAVEYLLES